MRIVAGVVVGFLAATAATTLLAFAGVSDPRLISGIRFAIWGAIAWQVGYRRRVPEMAPESTESGVGQGVSVAQQERVDPSRGASAHTSDPGKDSSSLATYRDLERHQPPATEPTDSNGPNGPLSSTVEQGDLDALQGIPARRQPVLRPAERRGRRRVWLATGLVFLVFVGLFSLDQWFRASTGVHLLDETEAFFDLPAWEDYAHMRQEVVQFSDEHDNVIKEEDAAEWGSHYNAVGNAASDVVADLVPVRRRIEGILVLPWHRAGAHQKATLLEHLELWEDLLTYQARALRFSANPFPFELVENGNDAFYDEYWSAAPRLCGTLRAYGDGLPGIVPKPLRFWSALSERVGQMADHLGPEASHAEVVDGKIYISPYGEWVLICEVSG